MDENGKTIREKVEPNVAGEFKDRPWHVDWKRMRRNTTIVRSSGTYLFSQNGDAFLDCVSGVSHVGHTNATVVGVATQQMARLGSGPISTCAYRDDTCVADLNKSSKFCNRIIQTFNDPARVNSAIVCNSGSHANDIAVQIARTHTGAYDVVVFQDSFHGCLTIGNSISSKMYKRRHVFDVSTTCYDSSAGEENPEKSVFYNKPDWVHVLPIPEEDSFSESDVTMKPGGETSQTNFLNNSPGEAADEEILGSAALEECFKKAKAVIDAALAQGRKIACILTEPIFTFHSVTVPDSAYMRRITRYIKSVGGLVIMDEVQTGLGRTGLWWGYQIHGAVDPDIVTTGKPLANGHPLALVITRRELANTLKPELAETYKISPLQEAIGNALFDVLMEKKLRENAGSTGQFMVDYVHTMMENRKQIGGITGRGLLQGIKIVDREGNPDPKQADQVLYKLRKRNIVTAVEGTHRNVLFLIPPLCFGRENALAFLKALDEVLTNSFKEYIAPALIEDLQQKEASKSSSKSNMQALTTCSSGTRNEHLIYSSHRHHEGMDNSAGPSRVGTDTDDTYSSVTTSSSGGQSSTSGSSSAATGHGTNATKFQDDNYDEMD